MEQLLITFIVVVIIFLIVRGFWLWYWRINAIVSKLDDINNNIVIVCQHLDYIGKLTKIQLDNSTPQAR